MGGRGAVAQGGRNTATESAFDHVFAWMESAREPSAEEQECLVRNLRCLADRVNRTRSKGDGCNRIELSSNIRNLAKMIGAMEMLLPPAEEVESLR